VFCDLCGDSHVTHVIGDSESVSALCATCADTLAEGDVEFAFIWTRRRHGVAANSEDAAIFRDVWAGRRPKSLRASSQAPRSERSD
jgi:hypothetical protein